MATQLLLQVRNLSKSFPGVRALDNVSLDVEAGKVHALTGENGAGKSTLMRILAGLQTPDSGQVLFQGRPIRIRNPHEALRLGIAMIHQELLPFRHLTVAENIWMGREPTRWLPGWLDKPSMIREARRLLQRLGVTLSPVTKMRELGVAEAQTVEIAKALACRAEVIIMDEPSSALSQREVSALFEVIADLKRHGVAVIYISHKMDEIFRVSDTVTVLRDGRHVTTAETAALDENRLIALMVGRSLDATAATGRVDPSNVVLEVRELTSPGRFRHVSFAVRRGEILGIAGLMGSGRTSLVSAISGLAPAAGEIRVGGRIVPIRTPRDAIAHGIAFVSEDRKQYGLVPTMSVKHNITLASLSRCCRGWFLDKPAENRIANNQICAFSIGASTHDRKVTFLSGGNQQKVVIAKALLTEPSILILDEPTRGIDIGAKAEIYTMIRRLAGEGKAIVMVSSEMAEILSLSDRILVMREGAITAELSREDATQEGIMKWAVPK